MLRNFLLLNPVYVTFLWAFVLFLIDFRRNKARTFLSVLMLVSCVLYLSHYFFFLGQFHVYMYLDGVYTACSLAVYPLFHIYVRLLTVDTAFSIKKHGRYLVIPLVFLAVIYVAYLFFDKGQSFNYVQKILPSASFGTGTAAFLKVVYLTNRLIFVIQAVVYLLLNFRLIARNAEQLQQLYSNIEHRGLNWLRIFNILFAIATFASVSLAVIGRENFMSDDRYLIFPSVVFSGLLFTLGFLGFYQSLTSPDDVVEAQLDKADAERFENASNDSIVPSHFKESLILLFEKDKVYLNKELKIWDITAQIGTNRTYVSKIINQEFNVNFCTFVNNFRVEEAKLQIHQNPLATLEHIADLSGFGSANSLSRAFYAKENQTIAQFKKKSK